MQSQSTASAAPLSCRQDTRLQLSACALSLSTWLSMAWLQDDGCGTRTWADTPDRKEKRDKMEGCGHLYQENKSLLEIFSRLSLIPIGHHCITRPVPHSKGAWDPRIFFKLGTLSPQTKYISKHEEKKMNVSQAISSVYHKHLEKPKCHGISIFTIIWFRLDQPWDFFGNAGRDWGQEEKMTEDEMAGWHHWLDGRESEWTLGVGDGQGGLVCCDSWGCRELDMTKWLNWTELNH